MLMPLLSVTAIGVVIGLVAWVLTGHLVSSVTGSVVGAWIGFLAGALLGVVYDVLTRSGEGVLVAGHAAAALGSLTAMLRVHAVATRGRDAADL